MGYASQAGRARTSSRNPRAFAVCDRCGIWDNLINLQWQYDYRGQALANTRVLVCRHCLDVPQAQLRAIAIPADPVPVINARVESFAADEAGNSPVYGLPVGLDYNAVTPYNGALQKAYRVQLDLISVIADGSTTVAVTCRVAHNLVSNDPTANQIAVEGLSVNGADGFYTVNVTSATAFTYTTHANILPGNLLTGTTRMITCNIGLPRGVTVIPQIGSASGGLPFGVWGSSLWTESEWD